MVKHFRREEDFSPLRGEIAKNTFLTKIKVGLKKTLPPDPYPPRYPKISLTPCPCPYPYPLPNLNAQKLKTELYSELKT